MKKRIMNVCVFFLALNVFAAMDVSGGTNVVGRARPEKNYIGNNAVRADVGKFILLKREGNRVALKITQQTRPVGEDQYFKGARYECYVFLGKDHDQSMKYVGEVYDSDSSGDGHRNVYIDCDTFRIEWSLSNWIYFGDSIYEVARTEAKDIANVDFKDSSLVWISAPWRSHVKGQSRVSP